MQGLTPLSKTPHLHEVVELIDKKMSLPHMKPNRQCTAKAKSTQQRCCNPAKGNSNVCRLHGWVNPERKARGQKNGNYKTGKHTQEAKAEYREGMAKLQELERIGFEIGLLKGQRTPGRTNKTLLGLCIMSAKEKHTKSIW